MKVEINQTINPEMVTLYSHRTGEFIDEIPAEKVKCPLFSESGYAFAEFGRDGCWVEDSTGRDITQYVTHWRPIERVKE